MVRIATLTVAVGMTVMILALAVVMGFKREITAKLVGFGAHVRIVSLYSQHSFETEPVRLDSALMADLAALPRCASVAPYALKGGMIKTPDAIQGVALKGLAAGCDTAFLHGSLLRGRLPQLGGTRTKELLISENIARMTGLDVGDRVEMLFVDTSRPVRRDRFKISGVYATGMDELDDAMTFTDIRNVQRLNGWEADQVSGYELMTTDFSRLDDFAQQAYDTVFAHADQTSDVLKVEDVVSLNPNTFDWLRAHNVNAAVIIVVMLLVAFLNMVSAMLIILLEKTSMIGMLKALGMRKPRHPYRLHPPLIPDHRHGHAVGQPDRPRTGPAPAGHRTGAPQQRRLHPLPRAHRPRLELVVRAEPRHPGRHAPADGYSRPGRRCRKTRKDHPLPITVP